MIGGNPISINPMRSAVEKQAVIINLNLIIGALCTTGNVRIRKNKSMISIPPACRANCRFTSSMSRHFTYKGQNTATCSFVKLNLGIIIRHIITTRPAPSPTSLTYTTTCKVKISIPGASPFIMDGKIVGKKCLGIIHRQIIGIRFLINSRV